jgi:hypothetical protein
MYVGSKNQKDLCALVILLIVEAINRSSDEGLLLEALGRPPQQPAPVAGVPEFGLENGSCYTVGSCCTALPVELPAFFRRRPESTRQRCNPKLH